MKPGNKTHKSSQSTTNQRARYNSGTVRQPQIEKHQRCESGSTGFTFPEPVSLESKVLPQRAKQIESRKKVQFRNVATEPDVLDIEQLSLSEEESSHQLSRLDTMVEHSVVVNEEVN